MAETKPLFDDEEPAGNVFQHTEGDAKTSLVSALNFDEDEPKRPAVAPLILPDDPVPAVKPLDLPAPPPPAAAGLDLPEEAPPSIKVSLAIAEAEHPSVTQAMRRGEEKFPVLMKSSGFRIRNNLCMVLPISFETLSNYGLGSLQRAAALIDQNIQASAALHEINADAHIKTIIERTDAVRHKSSLRGMLAGLVPFDPNVARDQLTAIASALQHRAALLEQTHEELKNIQDVLQIELATMAILADMTDHADIGALVIRRDNLFATSLQEVTMALQQNENIRRQVQEWIMRCDEVRTVTISALHMRNNLG
jgi:hypothetical protein